MERSRPRSRIDSNFRFAKFEEVQVPDDRLLSMAEAGRRMGVSSRTARKILVASGVRLLSSGDRRDYAWKSHVDALQAAVGISRSLKEAR
jgi:hypothetical protein